LFPFDKDLSAFVLGYRENPQPSVAFDRFVALPLEEFDRSAGADRQPLARAALKAFYVEILRTHPDLVVPFAERIIASGRGQKLAFGTEIVAYSGAPDRAQALSRIADHFEVPAGDRQILLKVQAVSYATIATDSGANLDILWAAYFGSGDSALLNRIVDAMNVISATPEETMKRLREISAKKPKPGSAQYSEAVSLAVGEAARSSLLSVSQASPPIQAQLREIAAARKDQAGVLLRRILGDTPPVSQP
jgi:hypothetical protein